MEHKDWKLEFTTEFYPEYGDNTENPDYVSVMDTQELTSAILASLLEAEKETELLSLSEGVTCMPPYHVLLEVLASGIEEVLAHIRQR